MKRRSIRRGRRQTVVLAVGFVAASLVGCNAGGGFVPGIGRPLDAATRSALVANAARTQAISPRVLDAVIEAESHGDPSAVSRAGAQGIMQLMPATSLLYGVANPFDAAQSITGGAHYLHDLLHRYRGDLRLALAAYNAGPGAVDAAHGVPAFAETRAYVARITGALATK